jgi:hypothetical protein
MRLGKSNYEWETNGDLLQIVDLNLGGRSVTNDIDNVINEIYQKIGDELKKYKILYRDSEGIWDGVNPTWGIKKCVGCDFYHIGETEIELAIKKIKRS